jgi:hypothetical protein
MALLLSHMLNNLLTHLKLVIIVMLYTSIIHIGGVMVSMLASSAVYCGFEPNAYLGIFQLYHGENKLVFNEMMMRSVLY